jgi:hypothetical protein
MASRIPTIVIRIEFNFWIECSKKPMLSESYVEGFKCLLCHKFIQAAA